MSPDTRNVRRTLAGIFGVIAVMTGLVVYSPTLYDWFCAVTGYGGTTQVGTDGEERAVTDHVVTVRFDGSRAAGMPWEFGPAEPSMEVRVGADAMAFYTAHNPTDRPIAGQATYNVTPEVMGRYFYKTHCFCFEMQVLQPGETVEMPVLFHVDAAMLEDAEAAGLEAITLSYTFHQIDLPEDMAALDRAAQAAQN